MSTGGRIMVVAVIGGAVIIGWVLWQKYQAAQAAAAAAATPAASGGGIPQATATAPPTPTVAVPSGYEPGEINTNPVFLANQAKLPSLQQIKGMAAYEATPRGKVDTPDTITV